MRLFLLLTLLPLIFAGCAAAPKSPAPDASLGAAPPRAVALRLVLSGSADAVFPPGQKVPVELAYGDEGPVVSLDLVPGRRSLHDLAPGGYAVTRIGPLGCTGIGFAVGPGAAPADLGTLRAEVLQTDYDVALISARAASPGELGDAEPVPLFAHRQALCHASRDGPGTEYRDLSPAERVMVAILFAGFCAAAVASGGFCAF